MKPFKIAKMTLKSIHLPNKFIIMSLDSVFARKRVNLMSQ